MAKRAFGMGLSPGDEAGVDVAEREMLETTLIPSTERQVSVSMGECSSIAFSSSSCPYQPSVQIAASPETYQHPQLRLAPSHRSHQNKCRCRIPLSIGPHPPAKHKVQEQRNQKHRQETRHDSSLIRAQQIRRQLPPTRSRRLSHLYRIKR